MSKRRKWLFAVTVGGGYSVLAIGADLALESAGWSFIPRAAVMLAILLGARRIFVHLLLLFLRRRLAPRA